MLGVHPSDTNKVVFGAVSVSRTINGGLTYQTINEGHADNHAFVNVEDSNTFFLGNDGGVYRIDWTNTTFSTNMNGGYITHQYYAGNYAPRGKIAAGGLQDNGTWRHRSNAAQSIYGGDGAYTHISLQDSTLGYVATQNGNMYRTNTFMQGGNFTNITNTELKAEGVDFINQYEMNYADGTQLFCRTAKGLWRTEDKGSFWTRLNGPNVTGIQAIGVTSEADPTVFVGGSNCFYRADNAITRLPLDTLKDLRTNVPLQARSLSWGTISIHPKNNDQFYVGMTSTSNSAFRLYRVSEIKSSAPKWTNLTGNLPINLPIYQVQPHPDKPDSILFAASAFGLYMTTDSGRTWVKETRVPNVPIFEMKLRASDRTLFLFTHGRGMFIIKLNDLSKPFSSVTDVTKIDLDIYPNPASDWLNITSETPLSLIQVFDLAGRERITMSNPQNGLDISALHSGQYILKAFDGEGRFVVKPFIKAIGEKP
jgi:Secretion system C-terminal sorting domain